MSLRICALAIVWRHPLAQTGVQKKEHFRNRIEALKNYIWPASSGGDGALSASMAARLGCVREVERERR